MGHLFFSVEVMPDSLGGLVGRIGQGVGPREETELAATAMQQMAATAQDVARNVSEACGAVEQADSQAGMQQVAEPLLCMADNESLAVQWRARLESAHIQRATVRPLYCHGLFP